MASPARDLEERSEAGRSTNPLQAEEWLARVSAAADQLTALALEWESSHTFANDDPDGLRDPAGRDPSLDYAIPHAAAVMEAALILRQVVVMGRDDLVGFRP